MDRILTLLMCIFWLILLAFFAALVSISPAAMTAVKATPAVRVERIISADYCIPCKLLRRDLAARGANITIVPIKTLPKSVSLVPTVHYSNHTTDTGALARMPATGFAAVIVDYELVTK